MTTENPAFADEPDEPSTGSLGIKARLKDGTLTSDEAIVLMEEQMEAREKQMRAEMQEQMDAKIAAARLGAAEGGATLISAVRGVVARLTETPTNFHQATVHFLAADAPEDEAMARWAPLLYAGSLAMVFLQATATMGVLVGTIFPTCVTSDQCDAGTYCRVGMFDRCDYCGASTPLPLETEGACTFRLTPQGGEVTAADAACTTRNHALDPNYVGFNSTLVVEVCTLPYIERTGKDGTGYETTFPSTSVASWCETCVRNDGTANPLTDLSLLARNRDAMGLFDDLALILAAFVVAINVVGELKDIELCSMAVVHAGDKLSKVWWLALGLLLGLRRWVFLPVLVSNVPMLVLYKGGDALSVCLNTVAILFLCDIDNITFNLALGERVRARVEDAGHVELDDAEAAALARTKAAHVVLIVAFMLAAVWVQHSYGRGLPLLALPLGGVVEAFVPGGSAAETAKRGVEALGTWLLGCVAIACLFIFLYY